MVSLFDDTPGGSLFGGGFNFNPSAGGAWSMSPQDKFMALMQGLSSAGTRMAQSPQGGWKGLAMGLGGLGEGIAKGGQQALMQRLLGQRYEDAQAKAAREKKQREDQEAYIATLPPEQQAMARANPSKFLDVRIDRSMPKPADTPFGFSLDPSGRVSPTPGAFEALSALEAQKTGARVGAERNAQNAVPLVTEGPEFKARVAGAIETAQQSAQLPFVGPRAAATEAATLPYAGPRAAAVANAQQQAQAGTQGFNRENSLRDEFTRLTGDFRTVQDAYNKIGEAAKAPTGAGDMSLLYSYVKLLDPGSVVRESEFATAAASGSLGERMQGLVQRVLSGDRLPDSLRKDFLDQATGIYNAQKRGYDNLTTQYEALAKQYGVDPKNVTTRFDTPGGGIQATPELPTAGFKEGDILTGPKGEQKIMRGGKWVDLK